MWKIGRKPLLEPTEKLCSNCYYEKIQKREITMQPCCDCDSTDDRPKYWKDWRLYS